jgi:hypothetical protein
MLKCDTCAKFWHCESCCNNKEYEPSFFKLLIKKIKMALICRLGLGEAK